MKLSARSFSRLRNEAALCLLLVCCFPCLLWADDFTTPTYGGRWIRLVHPSKPGLVLSAPTDPAQSPHMSPRNYADEGQLWCLTGEKGRFKIYNRKMGGSYALSLIREGKTPVGVAMIPGQHATLWGWGADSPQEGQPQVRSLLLRLSKKEVISFGPRDKANEKVLLSARPDTVLQWNVEDASRSAVLMVRVSNASLPLELQDYVSEVRLVPSGTAGTASGIRLSVRRQELGHPFTYYVPVTESLTAECTSPCRGYAFQSWTEGGRTTSHEPHITLPATTQKLSADTLTLTLKTTERNGAVAVFKTYDSYRVPYRIPALAQTRRGQLLAVNDRRYCFSDIGFGRVDIVMKSSEDMGATWSRDTVVLRGGEKGGQAGFGDPCLVVDRDSDRALIVCVAGDVPYGRSTLSRPQHIVRTEGRYDPRKQAWTWAAPTDMTEHFYHELLKGKVNGLFMSSGRILQSRKIKINSCYRLYAALCTHKGNYVVYSDDFGRTWSLLGNAENPCVPKGDEAKCEELPDGNVLISSRKNGGRWWNIYRFSNPYTGAGEWDIPVDSKQAEKGISNTGTPCNGEILLVQALEKASNRPVWLALQSIPAGLGRSNLSLYYKVLGHKTDYDSSEHLAAHWNFGLNVSPRGSAYSTLEALSDGRIGIYFEEEPEYYQMIYLPLTLESITESKYTALPRSSVTKKN